MDVRAVELNYPLMVFVYEKDQSLNEVPVFVKEIDDEEAYLSAYLPVISVKDYKYRIVMRNGGELKGEIKEVFE